METLWRSAQTDRSHRWDNWSLSTWNSDWLIVLERRKLNGLVEQDTVERHWTWTNRCWAAKDSLVVLFRWFGDIEELDEERKSELSDERQANERNFVPKWRRISSSESKEKLNVRVVVFWREALDGIRKATNTKEAAERERELERRGGRSKIFVFWFELVSKNCCVNFYFYGVEEEEQKKRNGRRRMKKQALIYDHWELNG